MFIGYHDFVLSIGIVKYGIVHNGDHYCPSIVGGQSLIIFHEIKTAVDLALYDSGDMSVGNVFWMIDVF